MTLFWRNVEHFWAETGNNIITFVRTQSFMVSLEGTGRWAGWIAQRGDFRAGRFWEGECQTLNMGANESPNECRGTEQMRRGQAWMTVQIRMGKPWWSFRNGEWKRGAEGDPKVPSLSDGKIMMLIRWRETGGRTRTFWWLGSSPHIKFVVVARQICSNSIQELGWGSGAGEIWAEDINEERTWSHRYGWEWLRSVLRKEQKGKNGSFSMTLTSGVERSYGVSQTQSGSGYSSAERWKKGDEEHQCMAQANLAHTGRLF